MKSVLARTHTHISLIFFMLLYLVAATPVHAYYTNMPASVVIGQDDFVSSIQGTSSNRIKFAESIATDENRLLITDSTNSRILIFNRIPESNGASADLVIGQSNFSNSQINQGGTLNANTLGSWVRGMAIFNNTLAVGDSLPNQRVLIFSNIPTYNNAAADFVVGQTDFISSGGWNK